MPDKRSRVALLSQSAQRSGAELAMLRLMRNLTDYQPVLWLMEDGPVVEDARVHGEETRVFSLPTRHLHASRNEVRPSKLRPLDDLSTLGRYVRELSTEFKKANIAIVHTNSWKSHTLGGLAARLAGLPHVLHARDAIDDTMTLAARLVAHSSALLLPQRVVANSDYTASTLKWFGLARPTSVSYEAPNHVGRQNDERPSRTGGPVRIGMLGRIAEWKGQRLLLEALEELSTIAPNVEVEIAGGVLFGDRDYHEEILQAVARHPLADRIRFVGHVEDVSTWLSRLDVLVHCSLRPGPFGQVVVEGLASGVAVVAADAGGPREVIAPGVDGLLFRQADAGHLAAQLSRLIESESLRVSLGTAGRRKAERFSAGAEAARITKIYDSVAHSR